MKTAVSIPDDVYAHAEALAQRLHLSRSGLYTNALRDYVARRDPDAITESINRVIDELGDEAIDPFVSAAAVLTFQRLEREEREE